MFADRSGLSVFHFGVVDPALTCQRRFVDLRPDQVDEQVSHYHEKRRQEVERSRKDGMNKILWRTLVVVSLLMEA